MKSHLLTALALGFIAGCASDPQPPPASPAGGVAQAEAEPSGDATLERYPSKDPQRSNIEISDRIKQACGLTDAETYFGYNRTDVSKKATDILKKLAECFTTGGLAGQPMKLVGHADPRGDEEYNMTLGGRRADAVKGALVGMRMKDTQISTTSRGEMEATGTDETSWAKDRRVEVKIDD